MKNPYKLTLNIWACNLELSIWSAMLAHQAVLCAEMMHGLSVYLREERVDRMLPQRPTPDRWLAMYDDDRGVFAEAINACPEWSGEGRIFVKTFDQFEKLGRLTREHPERMKEYIGDRLQQVPKRRLRAWLRLGQREARKEYREHLDEVAAMVSGTDDENVDWMDGALAESPEFYFCMRVWLMCTTEYAMRPGELMAQARMGDEKAIEKLIRLDDLAVHEPSIVAWINGEGGAQRVARQRQVRKWQQQGPIGQNHEWHYKQSVAGMLSSLSRRAFVVWKGKKLKPQPLTAKQIMHLFDALHRDKSGRKKAVMVDPDFEDVLEGTWSKAVRRYRKMWDKVFWGDEPDTKS